MRPHKKNNRSIHLVYSGIFAAGKGASRAVETMKFLPSNYILHLAGYGSEEETASLKGEIEALSPEIGDRIAFEGMLIGEDFDRLLLSCDIGLCTQDRNASYALTSFPSKVLNYLNHGLSVVAVNIGPLSHAAIANCIQFYEGDDPESVAHAIKKTKIDRDHITRVVSSLDKEFVKDLSRIIGEYQK